MPQPIHFSHVIQFEFTPKCLFERPGLAAHIAVISAMWNEIEARVGTLLAAVVGPAEAEMVISVFLAVKNDAARRATIDTVMRLKTSQADQTRFQEIMTAVGRRYDERNTIVHGAWGISPEYPDAILWCDVRDTMMVTVEMMTVEDDKRTATLVAAQRKMRVYKEADFVAIENRISSTYDELRTFSRPIMEKGLGPHAKVDLPPTLLRRK